MLSQRIKKIREQKNITQEQLSRVINCSSRYISLIETNEIVAKRMKKEIMDKIAQALNTTVPELFYTEEKVA